MKEPSFSSPGISSAIQTPIRALVVPVDAYPVSRLAVQRAIGMARASEATVVLVALLPPCSPDPELDQLQLRSSLLAADLGLGFSWYSEPADEDIRAERRYRQVLSPLADLVRAAGLCVRIELLRGGRFDEQFRRLIEKTPGAELILGNPLKLHDALHDLTGELLLRAPCPLHVDDLDGPPARRRPIWRRLVKRETAAGGNRCV